MLTFTEYLHDAVLEDECYLSVRAEHSDDKYQKIDFTSMFVCHEPNSMLDIEYSKRMNVDRSICVVIVRGESPAYIKQIKEHVPRMIRSTMV